MVTIQNPLEHLYQSLFDVLMIFPVNFKAVSRNNELDSWIVFVLGFAAGFFQLWSLMYLGKVGRAQGQIDDHLLTHTLQHNTALTLVFNSSWVEHII